MLYILKKYLIHLNYNQSISNIEEYYLSHPNFPSLFAVTDTLDFFGIPNIAAEVEADQIENLPKQFITLLKEANDQEFIFVEEFNELYVVYIGENNKKAKISRLDFIKKWTNIVVLIEENENHKKQSYFLKKEYSSIFILFLGCLFLVLKYETVTSNSLLFLLLSCIGLISSVFIFQKELNIYNPIAEQLCGLFKDSKSDCSDVLTSSNSLVFQTIKLSDLSIVYFSSTLFLTLFLNEVLFYLPISILLIVTVLYSVFIQVFKLKQYCNFCNLINSVLIATICFSSQFIDNFQFQKTATSLLVFLVFFTVFLMVWSKLKPLIVKYYEQQNTIISLKMFKRNKDVFNAFLQKNKIRYEIPMELPSIVVGSLNAKNELTLFLSASCKFCYAVFKEALLLEKNSNGEVKIRILFNSNIENSTNPFNKVLEIIIENYLISGNEKAVFLLNEWFINKVDLNDFISKYKVIVSPKAKQILTEHYSWCLDNDFNYSPVKIFNNFLLPKEYTVEELKFFMEDF